MEERNYKTIAEIIRIRKEKFAVCDKKDFNGNSYIMACDEIAKDLADYFENRELPAMSGKIDLFNKEQFLKDCGVN